MSSAFSISGRISSTPGALPPRTFLTTLAASARDIGVTPLPPHPSLLALPYLEGTWWPDFGVPQSALSTARRFPPSGSVHLWATLCSNMVFVVDKPSKSRTPLGFRSGKTFLPITPNRQAVPFPGPLLPTPRRPDTLNCGLVHKHKQQSEPYSPQPVSAGRRHSCSLGKTPNTAALSRGLVSFSGSLVPEPVLCVEVSPTIFSWYCSTPRTSSGSFPARSSLWCRRSARPGPLPRPPARPAAWST